MMKKIGTMLALLGIILTWGICINLAEAETQHSSLAWNGPDTCLQCHESEATDMHGSVHYQWQGQVPFAVSGPPVQGKLNTAVNSYCISILGNWNACGTCHTGLGAKPEATVTRTQIENIDCLLCHQKDYKRKKINSVFVPDIAAMSITMDQAVRTVHKPVRSNCLQCHAKGGGGDNNKRGDIALAHANTTDRNFDVHMATTGANLTCQSCHTTENHRIAGRGTDLRETDLNLQMSCSTANCHSNKLSSNGHESSDIYKHIKKVACQTCHIKTYARNASDTIGNESTEIHRDWTKPEWVTSLNRWEPAITRAGNQKPEYRFWNGYSYNYNLNELIILDPATGKYPTSRPDGGINDPDSKLFPFKYKTAFQPIATNISRLIALDTSVYFAAGDVNTATKQGLFNMGLNPAEPYAFVETDTYQLITHETMPSSQALTCTQCHGSTATQMNLKNIGYVLKGPSSSVCIQCHSYKSSPGFTTLHKKHVTEEKIDCLKCHNFTRASSPSPTTYNLNITKSGTGSGTVISSPNGINCGSDCSESYPNNTQVTFTATPNIGSTFAGWSGDADCSDGAVNMTASRSCTATFDTIPVQGEPDIAVSQSTLQFGDVKVKYSKTASFVITNKGTGTLTVTNMVISGRDAYLFRVVSDSDFTIGPSLSNTVSVRFTPRWTGEREATLKISSNDPDTPVLSIKLKGNGKR
ncbi:MAG: choice-of-anchor D domain-containing protein [Thermodesulfovibrionales bacterium]|nr:choice-of-anchor D domain-containing protein [Thermodesulfovibrionales bacterium]